LPKAKANKSRQVESKLSSTSTPILDLPIRESPIKSPSKLDSTTTSPIKNTSLNKLLSSNKASNKPLVDTNTIELTRSRLESSIEGSTSKKGFKKRRKNLSIDLRDAKAIVKKVKRVSFNNKDLEYLYNRNETIKETRERLSTKENSRNSTRELDRAIPNSILSRKRLEEVKGREVPLEGFFKQFTKAKTRETTSKQSSSNISRDSSSEEDSSSSSDSTKYSSSTDSTKDTISLDSI